MKQMEYNRELLIPNVNQLTKAKAPDNKAKLIKIGQGETSTK